MQSNHYLVPAQTSGLEKNIEYTTHVAIKEDAEDWFVDAKERLLDVNNWKKYSAADIDFKLTDEHHKLLNRKAHNRDHVMINTGIELKNASIDWVVIEALEYDDYPDIDSETFAMRVKGGEHIANGTPDLIAGNATSTIVIERIGKRLSASYHGRNESEDQDAAWLGLSDAQWADLIKGLID